MKSPLNYFGGKHRLAPKIVAMLPKDHVCYCEPFCGAAWVLFTKEPSRVEVLNDADGELVNFWRVVQNHPQPFLEHFRFAIISRKIFEWENMKRPETLTDLQRAGRYYYLQRLGFGGRAAGRSFGTGATQPANLVLSTVEEVLLQVHWRLERVTIEHLDACECIRRYDRPRTVFYVDPPYYELTQAYAVRFKGDDYRRLQETLRAVKGRFILSINDHPAVRAMYSGFKIGRVHPTYSVTNSRTAIGSREKTRHELLIRNF
jgi:DNA adenine methylase